MRRPTIVVLAALCAAVTAFAPAPAGSGAASPTRPADDGTASRTIVVLADDVEDVAGETARLLAPLGLAPAHLYRHALLGFAVDAPPAVLAALAADPAVAYVEADRPVRTAAQTVPRGVRRVDAVAAAGIGSGASVGVDVAILDTGIAPHDDLRIVGRLDCTDSTIEPTLDWVEHIVFGTCKDGGTDTDGHGTHVAGIVGAKDDGRGVVGVAPNARLWSIRVVRSTSEGVLSDVIAGVDEVARRAGTIEVANISLVADGRSRAMDDAVTGATESGAVVVVAAGNDKKDVDGFTPANSPDAITVSAVTDLDGRPGGLRSGSCFGQDDRFATYSNHGADIAAPGSCIVSTARGGGSTEKSGTSMAAPHVAGAAALRIEQQGFATTSKRAERVLDDLLETSARENTACGYGGSPASERLLDLRKGC